MTSFRAFCFFQNTSKDKIATYHQGLEFGRDYLFLRSPGSQVALLPSAHMPGPHPSLHFLPGVDGIINAWMGSKILTRKEFRQEVSANLPWSPSEWHWLSPVLQSPGHLAVSVAVVGRMKPIPLSLIKSPLCRHSLGRNLLPYLDFLPLLLNSNVMDLESPTCSTICSLSENVYILIA